MATLAETLGIYRDLLSELTEPAKPLSPSDPSAAAYNDAQRIAGNATGQTSKALQDLSAAKETVPVDPSDRTPADQAKLDKAKAEVSGLPLDAVTTEQAHSAVVAALMELDGRDDPHTYQRDVMQSINAWLRRHRPEARKLIALTSDRHAELQDRVYRDLLYPRVVKWDFPDHFSLAWGDMIEDLVLTLQQRAV